MVFLELGGLCLLIYAKTLGSLLLAVLFFASCGELSTVISSTTLLIIYFFKDSTIASKVFLRMKTSLLLGVKLTSI